MSLPTLFKERSSFAPSRLKKTSVRTSARAKESESARIAKIIVTNIKHTQRRKLPLTLMPGAVMPSTRGGTAMLMTPKMAAIVTLMIRRGTLFISSRIFFLLVCVTHPVQVIRVYFVKSSI